MVIVYNVYRGVCSTTRRLPSVHLADKKVTTSCTPGRPLVTDRTITSFHLAVRSPCRKCSSSKLELTTAALSVSNALCCSIQILGSIVPTTQYTPPTRLSCRVESRRRRRCEQNSQLARDDCRRIRSTILKLTKLTA